MKTGEMKELVSECCCIKCGGEAELIEDGGTLEALGYGHGTFICTKCGNRSSYYGEGVYHKLCRVKSIEVE